MELGIPGFSHATYVLPGDQLAVPLRTDYATTDPDFCVNADGTCPWPDRTILDAAHVSNVTVCPTADSRIAATAPQRS